VLTLAGLIYAEFKKLKGSSMLWIGLGSCFVLPVMALCINLSNLRFFTWTEYVTQNLWPQVILIWPCIFGMFGSFIFIRERIENTYKNLLTIPVGRIRLAIAKLLVLLISILFMCIFTYLLNISGIIVGVQVNLNSFMNGLWIYIISGLLMFLAVLPVILIAVLSKKGFLLAICVTVIYVFTSFLSSWVPVLAPLVPVDAVWRIIGLYQFQINYAFPLEVTYASIAFTSLGSLIGILIAAMKQEA
jgi:ABC-type transport system involved in multi-copper enzyme maturation permease subunit